MNNPLQSENIQFQKQKTYIPWDYNEKNKAFNQRLSFKYDKVKDYDITSH